MKFASLATLLKFDRHHPVFEQARRGKYLPHPAVSIFMTIFFLVALVIISFSLLSQVRDAALFTYDFFPWFMAGIILLLTSALILMVWAWVSLVERRSMDSIGFTGPQGLKKYGVGFITGLNMIIITVGLLALLGVVELESPSWQFSRFDIPLVMLIVFAVQGAGEEILFRGWLMPVLGAQMSGWPAILISSLLFSISHLLNMGISVIGFINIFLFGVFMSLYYLYKGEIWGICGIHMAWNWATGHFFGLQVSGVLFGEYTIIDLKLTGPDWLGGGNFGPEGSVITTIILISSTLVLVLLENSRKPNTSTITDPVNQTQEQTL